MKTIVVSGAAGFLGSHLTRHFVGAGYRVVALVRARSSLRRLADLADQVQVRTLESTDLPQLMAELKPVSAVIHTVANYGRQGEPVSSLVQANVVLGLSLLEAAIQAETTCFFNAGSALSPDVSPYALSKEQFSAWGRYLSEHHNIRFVDAILQQMYGEDDDIAKFAAYVIVNCLRNVERLPLTAGEQRRDFVYIQDVVAAFMRLVELHTHPLPGEPKGGYFQYAIGSGQAVTLRDFVQSIQRATGSQTTLDFGALPYRSHEVMFAQADISALLAQGWAPRYTLQEGIAQTVAWYKAHWKEIESCVG